MIIMWLILGFIGFYYFYIKNKDVGYTVIRTRSITETTLDVLEQKTPT